MDLQTGAVFAAITFGHDTLMGVVLAIAGILTIVYLFAGVQNVRVLTGVGALATIVIGILLFFGLA